MTTERATPHAPVTPAAPIASAAPTSGLHVREWGRGRRVAVLVHGISADSGGWWRVGPELARRGYRVLAPDLPGHGLSPRHDAYSFDAMAAALADAVPLHPELAVGHSLGGRLLALAAGRIRPERLIFEDPAWSAGSATLASVFAARKRLTAEDVAADHPGWAAEARRATIDSLARWDPTTAELVRTQRVFEPDPPRVPTLVVLADPSPVVPPGAAARLAAGGFTVRTVTGSGHVIHNDRFDGFLAATADHL
ncbi:alpha/beta fold hydrolase [Streptomyces sp. SID3343]|uniref:alpha/beta fold hydrolase n=1 Tax=Streptomyces sp. SID3343 TaxID=2690260 RepID=UPI00136ED63E|nr:alpha/beta fold hydrolase [Streptomyces sp. SID3343]MYV99233.1 alpha/beta fold hydrolase [Streptomyces sp. SID3343]